MSQDCNQESQKEEQQMVHADHFDQNRNPENISEASATAIVFILII